MGRVLFINGVDQAENQAPGRECRGADRPWITQTSLQPRLKASPIPVLCTSPPLNYPGSPPSAQRNTSI